MDKYEIIRLIETFAPPETAEKWDCSGWLVETYKKNISKIMLALTVTNDVFKQALNNNCDMIISHHPLFVVPIHYKGTDIYCAHTNMDLAENGTTDSLIKVLAKNGLPIKNVTKNDGFVRYVNTEIDTEKFKEILVKISPNFRYTENNYHKQIQKIALCAGSGSEFLQEAFENNADCFVTGDLKFHTALDSPIMVFDIGHFESEIQVLDVFKKIIGNNIEIIMAKESSPFKTITQHS